MALFIAILSLSLYSQLAPKAISSSLDKSIEPLSMSESIETLKDYLIENPEDFQHGRCSEWHRLLLVI